MDWRNGSGALVPDGTLDTFIVYDGSVSKGVITVNSPGTGLNNCPSETTLGSAIVTFATKTTLASHTNTSYVYSLDDTTADRDADLETAGIQTAATVLATQADIFASFRISMAAINQAYPAFNDSVGIRYALVTSTNGSTVNQDANGYGAKGTDWSRGWETAMNSPITALAIVPEPDIAMVLGGMVLSACGLRPRRWPLKK